MKTNTNNNDDNTSCTEEPEMPVDENATSNPFCKSGHGHIYVINDKNTFMLVLPIARAQMKITTASDDQLATRSGYTTSA